MHEEKGCKYNKKQYWEKKKQIKALGNKTVQRRKKKKKPKMFSKMLGIINIAEYSIVVIKKSVFFGSYKEYTKPNKYYWFYTAKP